MIRSTTSASNITRRKLCEGSERMEEGLIDEDSPQSRQGTVLHHYDANPELIPATLTRDERSLLDISRKLSAVVFNEVTRMFDITSEEPFEEQHEVELMLHVGIRALYPGHCDHLRWYPGLRLLVIIDKKFGFKVVTPAAANLQLRSYACMGAELYDADNVVVAITQPRLPFEERITMACYDSDDLVASRAELHNIWKRAKDPNAPLTAGEEQCRYCKAKLVCPAFTEALSAVSIVPAGQSPDSVAQTLSALPDDKLDRVLVAIQFGDFIRDAARDEARARIARGQLTGWKAGKDSNVATVTDTALAARLLMTHGFSEDDVLKCSKLSLTKAYEVMAERTGVTQKAAKDKTKEVLEPALEYTTKRAALTRIGASAPVPEAIEV